MIKRDAYLNKLIASKNNGFPKVITGIRRCGKSYLLEEIFYQYLIENGVDKRNVIIIDLDEKENFVYHDPLYLSDHIIELCDKNKTNYVIIDEIQNVVSIINPIFTNGEHIIAKPNDDHIITFANIVLSLSKKKYIDLYVTGSNSKMLSKDVQTEFRDKATNINVNPLSFEEYMNYTNLDEYNAINEYMLYGGMPLAVLKPIDEKKEYLKQLFETTYFKDIIERYGFRKTEALDELCTLLASSVGNLLNSEKLTSIYINKTKSKIDSETVLAYINAFKDSFIINEANRYDIKGKAIITSLKKYYYIDTGLRNARLNFAYVDEGQMLENIVYNELNYNGYSVNVGTYDKIEKDSSGKSVRRNYEIDFLATKGDKKYYIQVSSDISSEDVRKREIKPYISINDQVQKIIVINRPIKEMRDIEGYTIIGLSDFLLRFIK